MADLQLETELVLFGVRVLPDGLEFIGSRFYVCPNCGEGHVTDYGGGTFLCEKCDYQH